MTSDGIADVTNRPTVDYAHLPGQEQNPLMESTRHVDCYAGCTPVPQSR
jgi:hypothetical protein